MKVAVNPHKLNDVSFCQIYITKPWFMHDPKAEVGNLEPNMAPSPLYFPRLYPSLALLRTLEL